MYQVAFDSPWYLLLLGVLPLIWWFSVHNLAGLGRVRGILAVGLRSLVFTLLVLGLAEMQWVRIGDRLTVLYLLDQSLSISQSQSEAMLRYINDAIRTQRDHEQEDRAGVIVFGREAAIEIPPLAEFQRLPHIETTVDRDHTNLAGAMKLAQATFPHDSAKRVVIITDGNQNVGNAAQQARALADAGIGIDVVPMHSTIESEVAVEKMTIPPDVRRGQPFNLHAVLSNSAGEGAQPMPVDGRLQIVRKGTDRVQVISDQEITLEPGKRVFQISEEIDQPDFYTYEARFIPQDASRDALQQNNQAVTFTHVRGVGQALLLEDYEHPGEFELMVERLRSMNLEVTVRSTRPEDLFTDLSQLQPFDTVLLANVPREQFSDEQVEMLVRNTQHLGSGLVMLGGANSFGAGGWTNSLVEEAMPVDFQVKNAKVAPVGALVLVIDKSGSMAGGKLDMAKQSAMATARQMGDQDFLGVVAFDGQADWVVRLMRASLRNHIASRIQRMGTGGGTNMYPGMQLAFEALHGSEASVKHMIVLTDGNTEGTGYDQLATKIRRDGITISAVAVGTDARRPLLEDIARRGGGKFYAANNPSALPRIFQKEARRVARPLIFERPVRFQPQVKVAHEILQGVGGQVPPISGYVRTTPKDNPLVEVSLVSPEPSSAEVNAILASWTYGLGRAVALTTDAGQRWTAAWADWEGYDKFFSQMVRWSMRPTGDTGKYTIAADLKDGNVKVVVSALDKDDEFLNFLSLGSTVVGPDMKPVDLEIKQTSPGRYVGEFDAAKTGNYLVMISPGGRQMPLRVGVNVPYSDEFRVRATNEALLAPLAATVPVQGKRGEWIDAPSNVERDKQIAKLLEANTFRHDLARPRSNEGVWHLLVLAASCLFLLDVGVRRLSLNFDWVPLAIVGVSSRLLRREAAHDVALSIDRLRSRKAEVADELEQKRATLRFEPSPVVSTDAGQVETETASTTDRTGDAQISLTPDAEQESYTGRLLSAKKKIQRGLNKENTD